MGDPKESKIRSRSRRPWWWSLLLTVSLIVVATVIVRFIMGSFDETPSWMSVFVLVVAGVLANSLGNLFEGIGDDLWFLLKRRLGRGKPRGRVVEGEAHLSAEGRMDPVTIEVVKSNGEVVTLPPLRPDDKASIRTFVREAEKATGEQQYASAQRGT